MARELRTIPIARVRRPELDARIDRDPAKLEELARDILRRGLIYPIHVFIVGDEFEAVDGWTRTLASKSAGLETIEAFVYPTKDVALEGVKYASNIYRLEMNVVEEAVMFHELFTNECGQDIDRLASLTGRSFGYLSDRLNLLAGDELVLDALKAGDISLGVAKELNLIDEGEYRRYFLACAKRDGSTVASVRGWRLDYERTHRDVPQPPAREASTIAPVGVAPEHDPMRCHICNQRDNEIPEILYVHRSCRTRVLDVLLAAGRGGTN